MSRNLGSTELKRLHRDWRRRTEGRLALLLDGVQTPVNVGSILRTAAALRVDHLWLAGPTRRRPTPRPTRPRSAPSASSPGRSSRTPPRRAPRPKADGYRLVGVELADTAEPLHELDLTGDVCLAVGHEDRGLTAAVPRRLRRRRLPAAARPHRLAQRRHRRLHGHVRGPPPGLDHPADLTARRTPPHAREVTPPPNRRCTGDVDA